MNRSSDNPSTAPTHAECPGAFPEPAVAEFIDLLARLIAQEHHRRMAEEAQNRLTPEQAAPIAQSKCWAVARADVRRTTDSVGALAPPPES